MSGIINEQIIPVVLTEKTATANTEILVNAAPLSEDLALITEEERRIVLTEWNTTTASYQPDQFFHQVVEAQAERTPNAPAVFFENTTLTYQQLNSRANQLAHYLQHLGVGPEVMVGICVERSLEMIVGMLGVLKAGGAYVPLDPDYPQERLSFMLADTQVPILLTQQKLQVHLPEHNAHTVALDTDWTTIAHYSTENVKNDLQLDNLAYVIYTSGSTGKPKGALLTHRGFVNLLEAQIEAFNITSTSRVLQFASFSFDASVPEICTPLMKGAVLYLATQNMQPGTQLIDYLQKQEISVLSLTPSTLAVLPEANLPALETLVACGEACPANIVARWAPGRRFFNAYGPTENTVCTTIATCQIGEKKPSIGRPLANVEIYILDTQLRPVPIGAPGELYIGGMGLARGYLNRPELTVERFIPHPFSNQPGARLYKTGDEVRYRADGNIEFIGRLDSQVKVRGFRIELGEIEALITNHPGIREAVVTAYGDVAEDQRLLAYVVSYEGKTFTNEELQQHLSVHLPAHMLPSTYVYLDAFPLSPTGKVDRRALPVPIFTRETLSETYIAPQQTLHYQLIEIWEELLNIRPIGIRDDFFKLGGHSLLAVRLMAQIEQVYGKRLPLATLLEGATIEHLATTLLAEAQNSSTSRTYINALNADGTKPPIFFLHGDWEGKGLYCLKLAEVLGKEQPFYVMETYKYDDLTILPSLEEVAAVQVAAIRTIQPEGPYTLGGWCNGALFAYEMAQQLQAAGQKVDTLIFMEPGSSPPSGRFLKTAMHRMGHLLHLGQKEQLDWFLRLLHLYEYVRLWNEHRRRAALRRNAESQGIDIEMGITHPNFQWLFPSREKLRQNYNSIFSWWASSYKVEPYTGKIAAFWTQDDGPKRRGYWDRILAGKKDIEVYVVPGTHITSRTKYAENLGESLRACLSEVGSEKLS